MTKKQVLFWLGSTLLSAVALWQCSLHFSKVFPILDVQIKMDRSAALLAAKKVQKQERWLEQVPLDSHAVHFVGDPQTQNFIELEQGGALAFQELTRHSEYSPFRWLVRSFAEGHTQEIYVSFRPSGELYSFYQQWSETDPGPSLDKSEAQKIAEKEAKEHWLVPLNQYKLIEHSEKVRPQGRKDHFFTYEWENEKWGEGQLRIDLAVSGDQLSQIRRHFHIPESFYRKYQERRASNQLLANTATVGVLILYALGGLACLIWISRQRALILWKEAIYAGFFVSFFQVLDRINHLPEAWMNYDPSTSKLNFLMSQLNNWIWLFSYDGLLLTISFILAENLSRKAFPEHPRLWALFSPKSAPTLAVLGRVFGGYLLIGLDLSYLLLIYLIGRHSLGWWIPSENLYDPNSLAHLFPWFSPLSMSLHAGFWEEALFRALPLSIGALIGHAFGKRSLGIGLAMIIQAIIFSAAHANYPAQPYYARLIELIIPSFIFGSVFLRYGLLPGIMSHFLYDTILFAFPLMQSSFPGASTQRGILFAVAFLPLWWVIISRLKLGKWIPLAKSQLNQAMTLRELQKERKTPKSKVQPFSFPLQALSFPLWKGKWTRTIIAGASLIALGFWQFQFLPRPLNPELEISKKQALSIAQELMIQAGHQEWLQKSTISASRFKGSQMSDFSMYVQEFKPQELRKLYQADYLSLPVWRISFTRWDLDVAARAEHFAAWISSNPAQKPLLVHFLPEGMAGPKLSQDQALALVKKILADRLSKETLSRLELVSMNETKRPNRLDWEFNWKDPEFQVQDAQARIQISIAGSELSELYQFLHLPEKWLREKHDKNVFLSNLKNPAQLLLAGVLILELLFNFLALVKLPWRAFAAPAFLIFLLALLLSLNDIPGQLDNNISSAQPFWIQFLGLISTKIIGSLFLSLGLILVWSAQTLGKTPLEGFKWNRSELEPGLFPIFGLGFLLAVSERLALHRLLADPVFYINVDLDSFFPNIPSSIWQREFLILPALYLSFLSVQHRISQGFQKKYVFLVLLLSASYFLTNSNSGADLKHWLIEASIPCLAWLAVVPFVIGNRMHRFLAFYAGHWFFWSVLQIQQAGSPHAVPQSVWTLSIWSLLLLAFWILCTRNSKKLEL